MYPPTEPIKIYLDQKDYSRIGRGLLGNVQYNNDVNVYHFLIDLLNSNKIIIYYSACHAVETLKYDREKINLLKPYCKTIDSLTQGHCIKWRIKILELELELFLSRVFGFETTIKDDYPYGKFIDAFPFSDRIFSGFGLGMKEAIKAKFQNASIPRWQKRKLLKLLDKPKEFKKFPK